MDRFPKDLLSIIYQYCHNLLDVNHELLTTFRWIDYKKHDFNAYGESIEIGNGYLGYNDVSMPQCYAAQWRELQPRNEQACIWRSIEYKNTGIPIGSLKQIYPIGKVCRPLGHQNLLR